MKLEDQVCSLESARRLKELGVKQESLFVWECCWGGLPDITSTRRAELNRINLRDGERTEQQIEELHSMFSAFTVAELGEMLPELIGTWRYNGGLYLYHCGHCTKQEGKDISATTEAEARAKMLIYLIENKLMEIKP